MATTEGIRIQGRGGTGDTEVKTNISGNSFEQILTYLVLDGAIDEAPIGTFVAQDGALSITRASAGKQLKITSDGTLVGTTVETADDHTQINNIRSVTIYVDANGLRAAIKCNPVEVNLVTT